MKRLPWLSLAILFAAYTTFSWFLTHATATWFAWVTVLAFTVLQALLLTTMLNGLRAFVSRWLRSDVGYFTLIMITSLGITVVFLWFRVFGYFLVLIAAEILARLDLQNAGFNRVQSLIILNIFSLSGLAVGWAASLSDPFGGYFN